MEPQAILEAEACLVVHLHHHQPYLFVDSHRLSNLRKMWTSGDDGQRWNVACYVGAYAELPRSASRLAAAGLAPRIMADFSGSLLLGLEEAETSGLASAMAQDKEDSRAAPVLAELRRVLETTPDVVELLATGLHHPLFHPDTTPRADWRLQVAGYLRLHERLFGRGARERLRGFWLPEMALPGTPYDLYELIEILKGFGLRYLLLPSVPYKDDWNEGALRPAADSVEAMGFCEKFYTPHVLKGRKGAKENHIVCLVRDPRSEPQKGVDLAGQAHQAAQGLAAELAARGRKPSFPPVVTICSDGDNGDQMMCGKFFYSTLEPYVRSGSSRFPLVTATEYLEAVIAAALGRLDWGRADEVFTEITVQPEGYSWSGVLGNIWLNRQDKRALYEELRKLSAAFHQIDALEVDEAAYLEALDRLLLAETSCYTWWGGGFWLDQARLAQEQAWDAIKRLT